MVNKSLGLVGFLAKQQKIKELLETGLRTFTNVHAASQKSKSQSHKTCLKFPKTQMPRHQKETCMENPKGHTRGNSDLDINQTSMEAAQ